MTDLSIARLRKTFINCSGFSLELVFPSPLSNAAVLSFTNFWKNSFQLKSDCINLPKKSGAFRLSASDTFRIINNMFLDQLFLVRMILPNYQTSNVYACYLIFSKALKHDNSNSHRQVQWTNKQLVMKRIYC